VLKKLLFKKLYTHEKIARKMYAGKQAIKGLYKGLMEEERMLPLFYVQQLSYRKKHRVIADYIASMSDRYALNFYNEMYGKL
jgi:dGTPase